MDYRFRFKQLPAINHSTLGHCVQMRPAGLPQLQVLLQRYPRVRIVIDHCLGVPLESGPPYPNADVLFSLARHENIYLKLTPIIINKARAGAASPETFFPRVLAEFGAHRIAWGSNFPTNAGTLAELLQQSRDALAFASEEEHEAIFCKTAELLYPALRATRTPAARAAHSDPASDKVLP